MTSEDNGKRNRFPNERLISNQNVSTASGLKKNRNVQFAVTSRWRNVIQNMAFQNTTVSSISNRSH